MADKPQRYRLYFNFNHETHEYGPYPMHYHKSSFFVKKINGTAVENENYYLDQKTTSEIQNLYLNNKITMGTRYTIQSIPHDQQYDIITTNKNDDAVEFVAQNVLLTDINRDHKQEKKENYLFIEDCLILAEMSKHSNSRIHFGINHKIWTIILNIFPFFYFADYIIIAIKISWCFTSFWYLSFIDIALSLILCVFFFKYHGINHLAFSNAFEFVVTVENVVFDMSQIFYGCILQFASIFNSKITELLRNAYFQNACSIFINQNQFMMNEYKEYDPKIIDFIKNINYHILNVMSFHLGNVYLNKLREAVEDANVDAQKEIDELQRTMETTLSKYQSCVSCSHKTTHQIFSRCHCEEHTFDYAKESFIAALKSLYFNTIYLKFFGSILLFYGSFYVIGFIIQTKIEMELNGSWAFTLRILLYVRLFVDLMILVSFLVMIYVQYYHFQLQSFQNMDIYWKDPCGGGIVQSDAWIHFTLNGYCEYLQYQMSNYYICCLLYGLKIYTTDSLMSLISFSSIDTIIECLNHNEPFEEFSNDTDDKDEIAKNIQNTQRTVAKQLQRIHNVLNTNHVVIIPMQNSNKEQITTTNNITNNNVNIIVETENKQKTENNTEYIPLVTHFQRAAYNICRLNPNTDTTVVFHYLRSMALDRLRQAIEMDTNHPNIQRLLSYEGVYEFLHLLGFKRDATESVLIAEEELGADTVANAVYGLNGFVEPLLKRLPSNVESENGGLNMKWEFSCPNTRIHTISLHHIQDDNPRNKRVIYVDGCEYYNEVSSVSVFNIQVDEIIVVLSIKRMDSMWSNEPYQYTASFVLERYMKVFDEWMSQILESMVSNLPSQEKMKEIREKVIYFQDEYNRMLSLPGVSVYEAKAMFQYYEQQRQYEFEYTTNLQLIKSVYKPQFDLCNTAMIVYGFLRKHGAENLPLKIQNICVRFVAPEYQVLQFPSNDGSVWFEKESRETVNGIVQCI